MIKELPKDTKNKSTRQKSNPHHPQSFRQVEQPAMTHGTLPDSRRAPRSGARVGVRHGTNTEALGGDGAAGAAAMNAMEATDTRRTDRAEVHLREELVAETLRRDGVSDKGGADATPCSTGAPPGSPRKGWLSGPRRAGLVPHTLLGCREGALGSPHGAKRSSGHMRPTEDMPKMCSSGLGGSTLAFLQMLAE